MLTFAALSETKGSSLKELETTKYKQVPILTRLKSRKSKALVSLKLREIAGRAKNNIENYTMKSLILAQDER